VWGYLDPAAEWESMGIELGITKHNFAGVQLGGVIHRDRYETSRVWTRKGFLNLLLGCLLFIGASTQFGFFSFFH
jgi:hypothetical protein